MKRYIKSVTQKSQGEQIHDLTNKIYAFIVYEMFKQNRQGYYKQVRKQFTCNGRKYVMKNYSNGKLSITNPEGEELYGYSFGRGGVSQDDAKSIATIIINDAYGDATDISNKRVNLSVRSGYTTYGSNSGGPVNFGDYVSRLRRYADKGDPNSRYAAVLIKAWWSYNNEQIVFSNSSEELINLCNNFIDEGSETLDGNDSSIGEYKYRFYANVIDTETGEELYSDKSESVGNG